MVVLVASLLSGTNAGAFMEKSPDPPLDQQCHTLEQQSHTLEQPSPPCSICLEVPRLYGILSVCQHPFCVACITRYWDGLTDPVKRSCPVCKAQRPVLLPSNVWLPHNSSQKLLKITRQQFPEREDIGSVLAHLRAAMTRP